MSKDDFRVWLLRQPSRSVVGSVGVAGDCPIARWWSARAGRSCVIGVRTYRCPASSMPRALPTWVEHFTLLLDYRLLAQDHIPVGREVTREEALAVLVQVML